MKKILFMLLALTILFGLFVFYGCGTSSISSGGDTTYSSDKTLIRQQLANMATAIENKNKTALFAVFSDQFKFGVSGEVIDKASLEAGFDEMVAPYLGTVEVVSSTYTDSSITVYPDGLHATSVNTGANATVEGKLFDRLITIKSLDFVMGGSMPINILPGSYATARMNLPFVFTKEASTGNASDWKIVSFNVDVSRYASADLQTIMGTFLDGFMGTMCGTQSSFSLSIIGTTDALITSSITNEEFLLIDGGGGSPIMGASATAGLNSNTTYNPLITFINAYALGISTLQHQYKTRTAGPGSYTISGTIQDSNAGGHLNLFLVPWEVMANMFVAPSSSSSSIKTSMIKKLADNNASAGMAYTLFGLYGGQFSIRAQALHAGSGTTTSFDGIANVPNGSYLLLATQQGGITKVGMSQTIQGMSFEVTGGNVSGLTVVMTTELGGP